MSGLVRRQRLIPEGEKFSTNDRATAEKIAYQKWQQLRKENPSFAARILNRRQARGLATKDRALAEKIAARLWRQIQRDDPELAAYTREFEGVFGYPVGYNVQCLPKLDKVWPSWQEETARLERMAERPRMPVVCPSDDAESLAPLIQKMQKVDWLVGHVMVVFDEDTPLASRDIAIQSRGTAWYEQAMSHDRHPVICGCAHMDLDTRRIRITIYKPGFQTRQVLAEEIYHIGFKILCYESPRLFAAIRRWHRSQLAKGCDSTLSLADRFASMMALEETGVRTSLPSEVVRSARRLLAPTSQVPGSVMHKLITHWSEPLPA